jgi:hypothetical protein
MTLPGSGGKRTNKLRIFPRAPGDATPLDPAIADAMRKAGLDPERFTTAPMEQGESAAPAAGLFSAGDRTEHAFLFASVSAALDAIEGLIDDAVAARISKDPGGWLVVFDAPDDKATTGAAQHERFSAVATSLGAQDRGFSHLTMSVAKITK